jgi:hypothetical protein
VQCFTFVGGCKGLEAQSMEFADILCPTLGLEGALNE